MSFGKGYSSELLMKPSHEKKEGGKEEGKEEKKRC
tara:strand:- start:637 stop:741 length:105 start_codon:yes stop_codon:yes gene_type:complete